MPTPTRTERTTVQSATIRVQDLSLVLASIRVRKYTEGRTCRLCALSEAPAIALTCRDHGLDRSKAARYGVSPVRCSPIQRGEISTLFERVAREHGRREVLKTWGVGIRVLQAEPKYVLDGGIEVRS